VSIFATAMNTIFNDPHMAVDALWLADGQPPGVPVRLIRRAPDVETQFGAARILSETMVFDARCSEIPAIAKGDKLIVGLEEFTVQGDPKRDRERLTWTINTRPAS
jgi:hypothetical protein